MTRRQDRRWVPDVDELTSIGVATGLIAHLLEDDIDRPLGYRCQQPYYWESSALYGRVVPLWECGTTVAYYDPASSRFERCSLEQPDAPFCSYASLQSLLAELFIEAYEDEVESEELRSAARDFGFAHIDRMLAEVDSVVDDYDAWSVAFPATCGSCPD